MNERVFTFFDGPDAGRTFVLGDQPITLGREPGRDVVLHDDRASRLHARLLPDGAGAIIADAGSSNGTFVNGALVRERKLAPGDVIVIGANSFVFGREAPSPAPPGMPEASTLKVRPHAPGDTTLILPESADSPPLKADTLRPTEVLEALAQKARRVADERGISLSVESALPPDTALVDTPRFFYPVLCGMVLGRLLEQWPRRRERQPGDGAALTLTLRLTPDPARAGLVLEMVCVSTEVPRQGIAALREDKMIVSARGEALRCGGTLEILPADSADVLVRLRMPLGHPAQNTRRS